MAMSKEEYLKRYLSGSDVSEGKKKKKKKSKTTSKATNLRIFDDDVDLKSMSASDPTKTLEDELPDEEPTVAEIIDERPEEIQRLESYRVSDKWKQLGADSKKKIRHDSSNSDGSPVRQLRHDSDSDASPIREMRQRNDSDSDQSIRRKPRVRHDSSDSDQSPPRKESRRHDSELDSDQSPPRRQRQQSGKSDSDNSPPRRKSNSASLHKNSSQKSKRYDSDSDQSPPRKNRKSRHDSDSDPSPSPPRRTKHDSDSDQSPPRKSRRKKSESDSDMSPVRRKPRREDSDESPPRKRSRTRQDSDQSPPRRSKKRTGSDSDASPPRRKRKGESRWSRRTSESPERSSKRREKSRGSDSEEDERDDQGRRKKTLGGVKAGLSTGRDVRKEMEAKKRKEEEMFSKLDADTLGKNAKTVFRDDTGRRRNLKAEAAKDAEAAKKKEQEQAALKTKYDRWGKGMAQQRTQDKYVEEALHEVSKPLARFKDDEDLDEMLKNQEREEDPMLAYMKKKKSKTKGKTKEIPRYSGPQPPPNRYGIWPGYRWDGVDRSNGFEKKIFMDKANRKALENIKYKWSIEDM